MHADRVLSACDKYYKQLTCTQVNKTIWAFTNNSLVQHRVMLSIALCIYRKPSWKDGSTAVAVLLVDNTIYIGNLGDSKVFVCLRRVLI